MQSSAPETIECVGYIGLGIMGAAMAENLVKAGFTVHVWNRTPRKMEPLVAAGASSHESIEQLLAQRPQVVCINVSRTEDVREVLLGPGGITEFASPGLIVIDHSTINPLATRKMAAQLHRQGVTMLDAPVSGGDVGAREGTLSIMVGGEEAAFEKCRPVFEAMGKRIVHLGPSGSGQWCKAANQVAVACTLAGVCEALAVAHEAELDLEKTIDVLAGGAAQSWQLQNLGPRMIKGDYRPGFMLDLMIKDLDIIDEVAGELGMALPTETTVRSLFKLARKLGGSQGGLMGTQALKLSIDQLNPDLSGSQQGVEREEEPQ
ncbi:MAG: NAD(P)-dependent oxidoreductase [Phycisphaeraceae bacterium]|nr:NAD(P)-dependent oxidoreductase [Phycisphaeraceae bacterium]